MSTEQTTEFVPVSFLPAKVDCERRADGTFVLRSPEPLGAYARCLGEHLERWAKERPETIFLAQREGSVVAVIADPDAMINNPRPGRDNDQLWQINTNTVPPIGTVVQFTIQFEASRQKQ